MTENTTLGVGEYSQSFCSKRAITKTRVDHKCYVCEKPILKGFPAIRYSGLFEMQFFNVYSHTDCDIRRTSYIKQDRKGA